MKAHKWYCNPLALMALPALICVWAFAFDEPGMFGFLGFAYYLRYLRVQPDELFWLNVRKAAFAAWFVEIITLPLLFAGLALCGMGERALRTAMGLSFAAAILAFTIVNLVLEYREAGGISND